MVLAQSPAGPIEAIKDLKNRATSKYWRPLKQEDGSIIWQETLPLPSDPVSRSMYYAKGFRLSPPGKDEPTDKEALLAEIKRQDAEIKQLREEQKKKVNLE